MSAFSLRLVLEHNVPILESGGVEELAWLALLDGMDGMDGMVGMHVTSNALGIVGVEGEGFWTDAVQANCCDEK